MPLFPTALFATPLFPTALSATRCFPHRDRGNSKESRIAVVEVRKS